MSQDDFRRIAAQAATQVSKPSDHPQPVRQVVFERGAAHLYEGSGKGRRLIAIMKEEDFWRLVNGADSD